MAPVSIRRLTPEQVEASLVLARLHAPDLSLDDWRRLIGTGHEDDSGAWGAFARDTLQGILAFERVEGAHARFLIIRHLAVFSLFDAGPVLDPLLDAAEALARRHHAVLGLSSEAAPSVMRRVMRSGCVHQVF